MPGQDYNAAWSFVAAFAGDPATAIIDWRALHDADKSVKGFARRGTLTEWWPWLCEMNDTGFGVFAVIAMLDGSGRHLENVDYIRAHYFDNDNLDAEQQLQRASQSVPMPSFGVNSSPGKFHVYWPCVPYRDNDRFQIVQRKLRQLFNGDPAVIDATRVMRVPGTFNTKYSNPASSKYTGVQPHMVTCFALPGYGQSTTVEALEAALAGVNIIDGGAGVRHELGEPTLAAPSLDWLKRAMELCDPNDLDRAEWIAMTCAIKQAGWTVSDPDALFIMWSAWCARYADNDIGENNKQWNSIRNTELGWPSIVHRVPSLKATMLFGGKEHQVPSPPSAPGVPGETPPAPPPMPEPPPLDCSGEFLTHLEQQEWFRGCYAIETFGEIMTPKGRFMNAGKFNISYGGKKFIIDSNSKTTNEAWQAATRSTLWTIPKVDHIRFLPERSFGDIVSDQLGRSGVNTYIPVKIKTLAGDVSPFTRHMELMIPNENDRNILYAYLACNVKYPGHKIKWAPMIQSTEGVGKGFIMEAMETIIGEMYCYSPKAQELVKSGSTFNAWMRSKLLIIVNEIKVDERRELIEILKPMITDKRVEIQSKGVDQEMEDNPANWIFFSNFKDAIPVFINGRRYSIFYSAIQSRHDLMVRQMGDDYFNRLFKWLRADGAAIIAEWLMRHPITPDEMPGTAPATSSMPEAIAISRSPIERMILEAVEDALPGFRGGWISGTMVANRIKATGTVRGGSASPATIAAILEAMGYHALGRAPRAYFQEDREARPYLFYFGGWADVALYGRAQGWE